MATAPISTTITAIWSARTSTSSRTTASPSSRTNCASPRRPTSACALVAGLFYQRQTHNIEQNYIIDDIADSITVPTAPTSNIWLTKQKRVDRDYAAFGELGFDVSRS